MAKVNLMTSGASVKPVVSGETSDDEDDEPVTTPPTSTPTQTTHTVVAPKPQPRVTVAERETFAASVADRLAANPNIQGILARMQDADEVRKYGVVHLLFDMMTSFNVSTSWDDDSQVFRSWPIPDTQDIGMAIKGKTTIDIKSGNNVRQSDWYSRTEVVNGKVTTVNGSFFRDLYNDMDAKLGDKSLREQHRLVQDALSASPAISDNPYLKRSKDWLGDEASRLTTAMTRGAARLRTAMEVYEQITKLHDTFGDVVVVKLATETRKDDNGNWIMDGKKKKLFMSNRNSPIRVLDKDNLEVAKAFDVPSFLALDVKKAEDDGGEYSHIIASGKKKRAPGGRGKGATDLEAISKYNLQSFEATAALNTHFIEDDGKMAQLIKRLKAEDGEELLLSVGEFVHTIGNLLFVTKSLEYTPLGKKWKTLAGLDDGVENK
jgi:hypothetical protein